MKRILLLVALLGLSTTAWGRERLNVLPAMAMHNFPYQFFSNTKPGSNVNLSGIHGIEVANLFNFFFSKFSCWMSLAKSSLIYTLLASYASAFTLTIFCILKIGSQKQMFWINTRTIIAGVTDAVSVWVYSSSKKVCQTMSRNFLVSYIKLSISPPAIDFPYPLPASRFLFTDVAVIALNVLISNRGQWC